MGDDAMIGMFDRRGLVPGWPPKHRLSGTQALLIYVAVAMAPSFLAGLFWSMKAGILVGLVLGALAAGGLIVLNLGFAKGGMSDGNNTFAVPVFFAFPLAGFLGGALRAPFV